MRLFAILIVMVSCSTIDFDRKQPENSPDIEQIKELHGVYVSDSTFFDDKPDTLIFKKGIVQKGKFVLDKKGSVFRRLDAKTLVYNFKSENNPNYWVCLLVEHDAKYKKITVSILLENNAKKDWLFEKYDTLNFWYGDAKNVILKADGNQFSELVKSDVFEKVVSYTKVE